MRAPRYLVPLAAALMMASGALWAQKAFREYPALEGADSESALPADYNVPAEFVFGRLMYPSGQGDFTLGRTSWTIDYPRGDRTFAQMMRRLTTVKVRSVEQPVNLDDGDDVYDWPFLMVSAPGAWDLTDAEAAKLRDYLLRGGFLVCDSFFGTSEWAGFEAGLRKVFPDRAIVELPADHPIFHVLYDLDDKKQISNWRSLHGRGVPYRSDGAVPHWRAILDDDGRVMVAITFNNDMGDSWQWADDASYPQEDSNLGIRLGVDFALYDLTH
ncbi:MAG: DUF4159 domain-containing protein [Steroidobacteraceae bacterium]